MLRALFDSFESMRNKDPDRLLELHSRRGYTLFNDAPPFQLLEDETGLSLKMSILSQVQDLTYNIRNLHVKVFGGVAVAAYELEMSGILVYQYRFEGQRWFRRARCTTVLLKEDEGWRIVHEHFSPIDTSSSAIL